MGDVFPLLRLALVFARVFTDALGAEVHDCDLPKADANVTCLVGEKCILLFNGNFDSFFWKHINHGCPAPDPVFIVKMPLDDYHQDVRYQGVSEMKARPEGGVLLQISSAQPKHEGLHLFSGTSGRITTVKYVQVNIYTHVEVWFEQRGSELLCGSESVYPRPSVTWTGLGLTSDPQTSIVQSSETKLFSLNSSVTRPQRHLQEITCNISTGHSWRSATYRTNQSSSVMIIVGPILGILGFIALLSLSIFVYRCWKNKKTEEQRGRERQNGPKPLDYDPDVDVKLLSNGNGATEHDGENGLQD